MIRKMVLLLVLAPAVLVQAQTAKPPASSPARKPVAAKSQVDIVIELVKGGMSESMVIKTLQREGKAIPVSTADSLKLQKAGVSEKIIDVMTDPNASVQAQVAPSPALDMPPGGGAPTPAPAPPPAAAAPEPTLVTPFPADIPPPPSTRKRRVVVATFDYGAQKDPANAAAISPWALWYAQQMGAGVTPQSVVDDVGKGIRAMVMGRLQQAGLVTVLERNAAIELEQKNGLTAAYDRGSRTKTNGLKGADCVVTGDITMFGRDNTMKHQGGFGGFGSIWKGFGLGGLGLTEKEEKAVVAVDFRLVDAETSEVLLTDTANGESKRKSKSLGLGGLGAGSGGAAGGVFQNTMTSSGFEKTILGEATIDAVNHIVKSINEKIPQLTAKVRKIEGRVASITPNAAYLALSANDGVQVGDRFAIMQINNEILDPETKDIIDVEAEKVGELVVTDVRDKVAIGNYGGQPLSPAQLAGKGYQARLMVK